MDQLDRHREHRGRPPQGGAGGGDRRASPQVGRTTAAVGQAAPGRDRHGGRNSSPSSTARSRAGGCPTRWSSSTTSHWAAPARSTRSCCGDGSPRKPDKRRPGFMHLESRLSLLPPRSNRLAELQHELVGAAADGGIEHRLGVIVREVAQHRAGADVGEPGADRCRLTSAEVDAVQASRCRAGPSRARPCGR